MAAPLSCDQCEELLADYLLRALEPEALSAVTEHLSTCDRCRAQLAAYEAVLDQLAQAVPQQEPPAELGSRLLAAAVEGPMLTASAPEPLRPRRADLEATLGLPPDGSQCRALPRRGLVDLAGAAGGSAGAPALAGRAAPLGPPAPGLHADHGSRGASGGTPQ